MAMIVNPNCRTKLLCGQRGQILVEFILLLVVMVTLGILTVRFTNGPIGDLWKAIVEFISEDTVSFR